MSGDNFRREVSKLRRRVGEKKSELHFCFWCGQALRGARHAKLIKERHAEEAKKAKDELIEQVEAMAARQLEAQERRVREQAEGRGHFHEQGSYEGGQIASSDAPAKELHGVDVREQRDEQDADDYDRELEERVDARLQGDPVLRVLRERHEKRRLEHERARRATKPTTVNNGGQDDE